MEKIAAEAALLGYPKYKLPFIVVTGFLHPLRGVKYIVKEEICAELVTEGKNTFAKWIELLDDKDIKEIGKDKLNRELSLIRSFLTLMYTEEEAKKIVEDSEMKITLKFMKSESLEKRLNAITEIKKMVEQAEGDRMGDIDEKFLLDWVLKNNILQSILSENTHSEIIKRASPIFGFLARRNAISIGVLDVLWKCRQDKDEDTAVAIYEVIKTMATLLGADDLQFIFDKINKSFLEKYDDKLLTFMKDFTNNILSSNFTKIEDEVASTHVPDPVHDSTTGNLFIPNDPKLYFLPTFWSLMQDESSTTQAQAIMCLKYLKELLICRSCEEYRPQFLYLCIDNLRRHRSVPQSLELATYLLSMTNMKHNNSKISASQWITKLMKNDNLFAIFIEDCENYEKLVGEYCKKKGKVDEDTVIVRKQKHSYNLDKRLSFFEYIMKHIDEEFKLGDENIQRLCDLYIDNAGSEFDTMAFLNSFSSKEEGRLPTYVFNIKETRLFFTIIYRSRSKLMHIGLPYYKCFATYFKMINLEPKSIAISEEKIVVLEFDKLLGMDQLWDCVRCCEHQDTLKLFIDLLITLYTNLGSGHKSSKRTEIVKSFIDRCFKTIMELDVNNEELAVTNLVKLLAAMLDYDTGNKYEVEDNDSQKQVIRVISPQSNISHNELAGDDEKIEIDIQATVGQVKKRIANIFGIPFGSLKMVSSSKAFDSSDYDSILRIYGNIEKIYIQSTDANSESLKDYLAQNQTCINALFALLFKEDTAYVDLVWNLLNNIAPSQKLQTEIETMEFSDEVL